MIQLQTSVLKANKKQALEIVKQFELLVTPKGDKVAKITIDENLIEIKTPVRDGNDWIRNDEGKIKRCLIFRWSNSEIGQKVEWNPDCVTIK